MKVAEILNSLKDKLLVVKGNCDAEVDEMISDFKFEDHLLLDINGKKIYLNHFPFLCYADSYKNNPVWALSGHTHICKIRNTGKDFERMNYLFPTQYDVGVDFNDYTPVSFKEVEEKIKFQIANNVNLMYWVKS